MKKQLFIGSIIVSGSLFTTTQASANTINIQATQKQESTQLIPQDQITNTKVQDIQLQSSTNQKDISTQSSEDINMVVFNARNWYDGYFDMNNKNVNNNWKIVGTTLATYAGGPLVGAAYQVAWNTWASPKRR